MKSQHGFVGLMFFLAVAIAVSSSPIHDGWSVKYSSSMILRDAEKPNSVETITGLAVNDRPSACRSVLSQYGDCDYSCGIKGLQCSGASIRDVSRNNKWGFSCGTSNCGDESKPSCVFGTPGDRILVRDCVCC